MNVFCLGTRLPVSSRFRSLCQAKWTRLPLNWLGDRFFGFHQIHPFIAILKLTIRGLRGGRSQSKLTLGETWGTTLESPTYPITALTQNGSKLTFTPTKSPFNLSYMFVGGNWSTGGQPTQTSGEHANFTQKGPVQTSTLMPNHWDIPFTT